MDIDIVKEAMNDVELYKSVIEHRKKFIGLKDFDYSTLMPQTISFVPLKEILPKWEEDYISMQSSMIYGDSLTFKKLIERITDLNEQFRKIDLNQ